jgi:SAM-dependent methyltransferase
MLEDARGRLKSLARSARLAGERLVWGGEGRERMLLKLLGGYYDSLFRRLWVYATEHPHFYSHRSNAFKFGLSVEGARPETFYRGFLSSEIVRDGDRVLDIGCGDGFFTKRFLSARASAVDGVDIEPSAIEEALKFNRGANVTYTKLDAVNDPFPAPKYDVVIWDGALGHFAADATHTMFTKIAAAIGSDGIFAGSESLGREGHDHLQFFETLDDLGFLLRRYWGHVLVKELVYPIEGGFVRREAYWRCTNNSARLEQAGWTVISAEPRGSARPLPSGPALPHGAHR